jgi:hypothetical protein
VNNVLVSRIWDDTGGLGGFGLGRSVGQVKMEVTLVDCRIISKLTMTDIAL